MPVGWQKAVRGGITTGVGLAGLFLVVNVIVNALQPAVAEMATRFGVAAIEQIKQGHFGAMVAMQGNRITAVPLAEVLSGEHKLDLTIYELATVVQ